MIRVIRLAEELTPDILETAITIHDGWYANARRIDWDDLFYRLEEQCDIDLGDSMLTVPIIYIQNHIKRHRSAPK